MSASLVGSEMCIRDRNRTCRGGLPAEPIGPWGAAPASSSRDRAWLESVSYTHLTLPTICSV
eukprot:9444214-Alexandrium_andersonii.AAC.1